MTCVIAEGGRIGLNAGKSVAEGGWSFTFITFGVGGQPEMYNHMR